MRPTLVSRVAAVPLVLAFALAFSLVLPVGPAAAQDQGSDNPIIVLTGRADVLPAATVDGVIILDGPAVVAGSSTSDVFAGNGDVTVLGSVDGDVTVLNGDVSVAGQVTGSVAATNGRATVLPTATVQGDVESSEAPQVAPLATVGGTAQQTDFASRFQAAQWAVLIGWWIGVSLLTLVAGLVLLLVFRRAGEATVEAGRRSVGPSVLAALVVGIAVPIVAAAVLVTLVGVPLGASVLLGFALLLPVAYAVTATILGSLVVKGSRVGAFLAGWAVLRLLALVPGLGALVWVLATLYGLGALTIAALRAGREAREEPVPAPPPGSPPPTATTSGGTPTAETSEPGGVPDPRATQDVPTESQDRDR